MSLDTAVMFSRASDEWSTPQALFDALDAEFGFAVDAAATRDNTKCAGYFGTGGLAEDALTADWRRALDAVDDGTGRRSFWLNCPYSRCREFIGKVAEEARNNRHTVVCLIPARTDTRMWHDNIWDDVRHCPRPGVEVRFIRGRLKFGDSKNSAPFPSAVVVFKPVR